MHFAKFLLPLTLLAFTALPTLARPNVVVIISDDGGFADWEFMDDYIQTINPGQAGSPVPTPNLNSLNRPPEGRISPLIILQLFINPLE